MSKTYISAPLPFMGQKRKFIKEFKEALKQFDDKATFVDLLGGSGLLSHVVKRQRPDARVIYNDYDDYHLRLKAIDLTNALIGRISELTANIPREKVIPDNLRTEILNLISEAEKTGFVDYITLSSSLLFSMNYVTSYEELCKEKMYNSVRKTGYCCDGYLDGLELTKCDYKVLFERFKDDKNVVFIVDPPYLSTEVSVYKTYWRLSDYLDVLHVLKGTAFVYFTSNKSSILELLEWMDKNTSAKTPFKNAVIKTTNNQLTHNAKYTDVMIYKNAV